MDCRDWYQLQRNAMDEFIKDNPNTGVADTTKRWCKDDCNFCSNATSKSKVDIEPLFGTCVGPEQIQILEEKWRFANFPKNTCELELPFGSLEDIEDVWANIPPTISRAGVKKDDYPSYATQLCSCSHDGCNIKNSDENISPQNEITTQKHFPGNPTLF